MDQIEQITTDSKGDNIMTDQKRTNKAFTLVEVLISLAIIALLMTALTTAINASIINHTVNKDTFKAMNTARQALLRITTELRTINEFEVEPAYTGAVSNQVILSFDDDNDSTSDRVHTYHYNKSGELFYDSNLKDNTLYLITNTLSGDTPYLLCENVTDMTFTRTPAVVFPSTDLVKNVIISITVKAGDVEKTVATAAVIRRNME